MSTRVLCPRVEIPRKGKIIVDLSGLIFTGSGTTQENRKERRPDRIMRMSEYYDIFVERGNITTTPGVLREIFAGVGYLEEERFEAMEYFRGERLRGHRKEKAEIKRKIETLNSEIEVNNKMYSLLSEGIGKSFGSRSSIPHGKAKVFTDKFVAGGRNDEMSEVDREVVIEAIVTSPSGILSADKAMTEAWVEGIKRFGLKDCFLCDARTSSLDYIRVS